MRSRALAVLSVSVLAVFGQQAVVGRAAPPAHAQLRTDQAGYVPDEPKTAILMTSQPAGGVAFDIKQGDAVVRSGQVSSTDRGSWNSTYQHTYAVTFSWLHAAGTYELTVHSTPVVHASIRVRSLASLYRSVLSKGVLFDQLQRDGKHVIPGALGRKPSHLHDAHASIYRTPTFNSDDEIKQQTLTKIGGPVDVEGGWFDAGDFLKFTHSTSFADVILLQAQRELGASAPSSLAPEGRYGLAWLSKMWRPKTKTLLLQVGTGTGTANGKIYGDHDLFRLPEADDGNSHRIDRFAAAHRPVFRAARPGKPISPNLAGRLAAAFALGAQLDARSHPSRARDEYRQASAVLKLADTSSPPHPLVTALPNDFYPEDTWRDDMELGTAEAALAAQRLHKSSTQWLRASTHWAKQYLDDERGDTFNLYDTSALAHADLIRALHGHHPSGLALGRPALLGDLVRQLHGAAQHAQQDPFHAAGNVDEFDVDSHTFGLIATAGWYRQVSGKHTFDAFAAQQRDWLFGTNAWGVSFMVGVGTRFPHCMQHQVANINGSTDGSAPIATGAVVNGPNSADLFSDGLGGFQDGMKHCSEPSYQAFDGHGSRFVDDVRSWQTDEPALDMTGNAIAAAAAQLGG